jgi:hypothetical protein
LANYIGLVSVTSYLTIGFGFSFSSGAYPSLALGSLGFFSATLKAGAAFLSTLAFFALTRFSTLLEVCLLSLSQEEEETCFLGMFIDLLSNS